MTPQIVNIETVLEKPEDWSVIDVRSPKEYQKAHLPGAINIPLLNDEDRHLVGVEYKQKGRASAVHLGLQLVGPRMDELLHVFEQSCDFQKKILFYCWRGGLRSGISSSIFSWAGHKTHILNGGYKSFRTWVLSSFEKKYKLRILGGATGSGKTEILLNMKEKGVQVIDLEGLANHKGSAFGGLGQKPQPSTEAFENSLALELQIFDSQRVIWLENESHLIGTCYIPNPFWDQMTEAPILKLNIDTNTRVERLLKEYGHFEKSLLIEKTNILKRKLGGQHAQFAIESLEQDRRKDWLETVLVYYDKTYGYGIEKNQHRSTELPFDWNNSEQGISNIINHELNK
jgi:tRNA 2-selenouridine synthase